jgi:hypothetical protein
MCFTVRNGDGYADLEQNYAYNAPNTQNLVGGHWPPTRFCVIVRIWCVICVILL